MTIPAGATSVQLRLATTDDVISEGNETFTLTATPVSGATTAVATGTATITDNDGAPQFSINDVTVNEGAGTITFTVSLSNPGAGALTVDYATASGTATAGTGTSDVTAGTSALTGTLTFAPGVLTQTVTLNVTNDTIYEVSEAFAVNLSNASAGAGIADGIGAGTIKDDGTGGPPGTDNDTPTLTPHRPGHGQRSRRHPDLHRHAVQPRQRPHHGGLQHGQRHCHSGADFGASSGTLTFAPNVTSQTFTVAITNDTTFEGAENYTANLSAPTGGATIATGTVTTTINDDGTGGPPGTDNDTPTIAVSVLPASVLEDGIPNLVYTFTLSNTSAFATTVNYTLSGTAANGTDYSGSAVTGTVTIPANSLSASITIDPSTDTTFEGNETVVATINSATSNAVPLTATTASATGTITDNDTPTIAVSVLPVSVLEDGIPNLVYTFTLSTVSAFATTVNYTLSGTAANGTDYSGSAVTGTVTIPANSLSASITIDPSTDTTFEGNETVIATINSATSNAVPLTATTASATGTITDNDTPTIAVSVLPVSVLRRRHTQSGVHLHAQQHFCVCNHGELHAQRYSCQRHGLQRLGCHRNRHDSGQQLERQHHHRSQYGHHV
ncbi:MAG: hypothetical protein IPG23_05515 [Burkholderiales bacterium]|nr:hypothetical protein [Burkholderiales bacterium]